MDQITSIKEPFEFASADLVKKANGFYLHCLLYVQKDISKEPEQICLPSVGIDTGIKDQLSFSKA